VKLGSLVVISKTEEQKKKNRAWFFRFSIYFRCLTINCYLIKLYQVLKILKNKMF